MARKKIGMEIMNPNAAGVDIGSRSHYVAIGQRKEDVKEIGVYAEDHQSLILWLNENQIKVTTPSYFIHFILKYNYLTFECGYSLYGYQYEIVFTVFVRMG